MPPPARLTTATSQDVDTTHDTTSHTTHITPSQQQQHNPSSVRGAQVCHSHFCPALPCPQASKHTRTHARTDYTRLAFINMLRRQGKTTYNRRVVRTDKTDKTDMTDRRGECGKQENKRRTKLCSFPDLSPLKGHALIPGFPPPPPAFAFRL